MPDSRRIVTDVREYHLVSGRHELDFLELGRDFSGGVGVVARVQLDANETHGYAFAPEGKTFRTVAFERDAAGTPTKLEVLEVDATTGKTLKSLLKLDYGDYTLSPDGKRLATIDKSGKVTVYDLDRGAKLSAASLPESPVRPLVPKGGIGPREPPPIDMIFSPVGRRLVISRDVGQTVVLNADTGEALPALEGGET